VIQRTLKKEIKQAKAGELLGLSKQHIRRLVKRVRKKGMPGLVHGNRERPSPRKMSLEFKERIASILGQQYRDLTPLHAAEKLWERHKVRASREKVRRIMMAKGCGGSGGGGRRIMSGGRGSLIPGRWCSWTVRIRRGWRSEGRGWC
jgi:transposase